MPGRRIARAGPDRSYVLARAGGGRFRSGYSSRRSGPGMCPSLRAVSDARRSPGLGHGSGLTGMLARREAAPPVDDKRRPGMPSSQRCPVPASESPPGHSKGRVDADSELVWGQTVEIMIKPSAGPAGVSDEELSVGACPKAESKQSQAGQERRESSRRGRSLPLREDSLRYLVSGYQVGANMGPSHGSHLAFTSGDRLGAGSSKRHRASADTGARADWWGGSGPD